MLDISEILYTQGIFLKVQLIAQELKLEFLIQNGKSDVTLYSDRPHTVLTFPLPDEFSRQRIIGKPVCIGIQDYLYVFQYITTQHKYLRFFTLDARSGNFHLFEDTQNYFHRNFTIMNALECHISPDYCTILLRLPQNLMTCRKWAKLLMVDKLQHKSDEVITIVHTGTKASPLRDRKFQAIAFYPGFPHRLVTALVDEFCSRCKFAVCDVSGGNKTVMQKVHRLGTRSITIKSDSDSESEEEDETYFTLQHISMAFCKSGDIVCLTCGVLDNQESYHLKVFTYDPQSLVNLTTTSTKLSLNSSLTEFSPILTFSVCDSELQIWEKMKECDVMRKLFSMTLPKPMCLKSLCRASILNHFSPNIICDLNLPKPLINYLQFRSSHS